MRHLVFLTAPLGRPILAVAVTGHGFGHAVRMAAVVEVLLRESRDIEVHVRGDVPTWLFPSAEGRAFFHPARLDVGVSQPHALTLDLERTLDDLDVLEQRWNAVVDSEARWLRSVGATLVLADIPPLAIDTADRASVPSLAVGNFSWDWIYRSYCDREPRFARHAWRASDAYRKAAGLLRLPFHGDMSAFALIRDVPLIARRSALTRSESRRRLGLPEDRPVVLLSFGGIGFTAFAAEGLAQSPGILFVTTDRVEPSPVNLLRLERVGLDYTTLLRACDAVVTKPGYGITAASLVNRVRVLYTSRGEFPEYPILVHALETHGTARFIDPERLRRGDLGADLEALLSRPLADSALESDGDEVVARIILEQLHGTGS